MASDDKLPDLVPVPVTPKKKKKRRGVAFDGEAANSFDAYESDAETHGNATTTEADSDDAAPSSRVAGRTIIPKKTLKRPRSPFFLQGNHSKERGGTSLLSLRRAQSQTLDGHSTSRMAKVGIQRAYTESHTNL